MAYAVFDKGSQPRAKKIVCPFISSSTPQKCLEMNGVETHNEVWFPPHNEECECYTVALKSEELENVRV